ncbi:MAG: DUF167 family protein [Candidatus Pacearchaeota archaeon]|jgi:uncharacterized protein YggU (UPF0235/DUF167 family)
MIREVVVKVKPGNMRRSIENFGNGRFLARVGSKTHPEMNAEVIEMLAKYLGHPESRIQIKSGIDSEDKVFVLD